mmetsp:Transcript_128052/g.362460  ORF Transcript_128052/g.362460 Transcript_128052/m.362460 type:complete len:268 (-) Transcript_128052:396-1199(-)
MHMLLHLISRLPFQMCCPSAPRLNLHRYLPISKQDEQQGIIAPYGQCSDSNSQGRTSSLPTSVDRGLPLDVQQTLLPRIEYPAQERPAAGSSAKRCRVAARFVHLRLKLLRQLPGPPVLARALPPDAERRPHTRLGAICDARGGGPLPVPVRLASQARVMPLMPDRHHCTPPGRDRKCRENGAALIQAAHDSFNSRPYSRGEPLTPCCLNDSSPRRQCQWQACVVEARAQLPPDESHGAGPCAKRPVCRGLASRVCGPHAPFAQDRL